jgi:CRP/FNR family transcriptional regulator, cyclic AMP receptor protein
MAAPRPLDVRAAALFDIDRELGEAIDPGQLARARRRAIVAVVDVPAGPWSPLPLRARDAHPFALLVIEGLLMREQMLAASTASEVLGPGDVIDLGTPTDPLVPSAVRWTVPDAATMAILDDRVLGVIRAWPVVGRTLFTRAVRRSARLATHRAIAQLPRVDQRLLAFFALTAERWGRVSPAGLVIPLHFTHETLGRLIGARRPTVSLALKELSAAGLLERRRDGAWLLRDAGVDALSGDQTGSSSWHAAEARVVAVPEQIELRMTGWRHEPDEVAALRERVALLREEHRARIDRYTATLESSRATRVATSAARRPPA